MSLASHRSQELHLRPESRTFLPELGKPDIEFTESKRPRLELLPDTLLRPSPLLATGQPSGTEDLTKVHPSHTDGLFCCCHCCCGQERGWGGGRERLGRRSEVSSGMSVSGTERWGCSQARRVGMGDGENWERYL